MNALRHWKMTIAVLVLLSLLLTACSAQTGESIPEMTATPAPQTVEPKGKVYYTYFDTVSYVYDYAGDSAERFDERSAEVSHILLEYHQLFDIYHEYSGVTNLCTLNKNAGGEPMEVDERLIDFLLDAREMYELTGGEMNVMLGAVLRLWHDCREAAESDPSHATIPAREQLEEAYRHTDISLLEIDEEKRTVRIADAAASIDVGALGKGYATERAAEYLEREGARGYVLNIGGNIRCIGDRPDGSGWVTAVRHGLRDLRRVRAVFHRFGHALSPHHRPGHALPGGVLRFPHRRHARQRAGGRTVYGAVLHAAGRRRKTGGDDRGRGDPVDLPGRHPTLHPRLCRFDRRTTLRRR